MTYIDADLLRKEIEKNKNMIDGLFTEGDDSVYDAENDTYNRVLRIIDSLQQEQQESSNGKFVFPNFLYARTVDNKTIDVSYAPQSLDAVEYIKNDTTERQEVDLEEEMDRFFEEMPVHEHENIFEDTYQMIARHFTNFGKNSK